MYKVMNAEEERTYLIFTDQGLVYGAKHLSDTDDNTWMYTTHKDAFFDGYIATL